MHNGVTARRLRLAALVGLVSFAAACEPDSITEAREILQSDGADTLVLTLPLLTDSVLLVDVVEESDTASTGSGAFGIRAQRQSLEVGIADALSFEGIAFDAFSLGYGGLLQTGQVSESFTVSVGAIPPAPVMETGAARTEAPARTPEAAPPFGSQTVRFETGGGASVVAAEIASGFVVRTVQNTTTCDLSTAVDLRDSNGTAIASFPPLSVAAGVTTVDSVDLSGVVLDDEVEPDVSATVTSCTGLPSGDLTVGFTFRPLSLASVTLAGIDETFSGGYAPLDARFDPIDTLAIDGGQLLLDVTSRVPLDLALSLQVDGLLENGAPLTRTIDIPAAPPSGTVAAVIDLMVAGTTLIPADAFVQVTARATADTAVVTPGIINQAAEIAGAGRLDVASVVGTLDPLVTPELSQPVDVQEAVLPSDVDFGDLEDAAGNVEILDAEVSFSIDNGLGLALSLDTVRIGVARTDASGTALRNGDGSYALEEDDVGQAILVPIAPPGTDALAVPGQARVEGRRQAAALIDRIVELLLDDETVALVATGGVSLGDGTPARVQSTDSVSIALDLVVGFDVVLPDSGLVFDVTESFEGAGLEPEDRRQVEARLIDAAIVADVVSDLPLRLTAEIVLVPRPVPEPEDPFAAADRIEVGTVLIPSASVDPATGASTDPAVDSIRVVLTGSEVSAVLGDSAAVGVRFRVQGDAAAGGRARMRTDDRVGIRLRSVIRALLGGGS